MPQFNSDSVRRISRAVRAIENGDIELSSPLPNSGFSLRPFYFAYTTAQIPAATFSATSITLGSGTVRRVRANDTKTAFQQVDTIEVLNPWESIVDAGKLISITQDSFGNWYITSEQCDQSVSITSLPS